MCIYTGIMEAALPRISSSLVYSNLESYLVTFLFKNDIKTQEQLFQEIRKPYSPFLQKLSQVETKKLTTAFFSLN